MTSQKDQLIIPEEWAKDIPEEWEEREAMIQHILRCVNPGAQGDTSKLMDVFMGLQNGTLDMNDLPGFPGRNDEISVPIQKLDKCRVCYKTTSLRLCNSCASAIYCSKECQRADWQDHKKICSRTEQINLKTFYPFIAFLFDSLRRPNPQAMKPFYQSIEPYTDSVGPSREQRPLAHPALSQKILRAPMPGPRKAKESDSPLHHSVVLGVIYNLEINRIPHRDKLQKWWRGKSLGDAMRLYLHVIRESDILEITVAVSLLLLAQVYSTRLSKSRDSNDHCATHIGSWEERSRYRLEFGHSPVTDFGICKGRIQGKASRLQTWTYYHPKSNTRTTVLDPNNHYWMYFRTIKGEEITLDCCSSAYGMTTCVDASSCLKTLPKVLRDWGSTRTPAYFHPLNHSEDSHVLIEEKRFSVMQNKLVHEAVGWEILGPRDEGERDHLCQFIEHIQEKPCTASQLDRTQYFQVQGGCLFSQILLQHCWKDWERPEVYSRDESFDSGEFRKDLFIKGSMSDSNYSGRLTGVSGMIADALGAEVD